MVIEDAPLRKFGCPVDVRNAHAIRMMRMQSAETVKRSKFALNSIYVDLNCLCSRWNWLLYLKAEIYRPRLSIEDLRSRPRNLI
jgi:hypothetical protein